MKINWFYEIMTVLGLLIFAFLMVIATIDMGWWAFFMASILIIGARFAANAEAELRRRYPDYSR